MTRATALAQYRDVKTSLWPDGVQSVLIDPDTCSFDGQLSHHPGRGLMWQALHRPCTARSTGATTS